MNGGVAMENDEDQFYKADYTFDEKILNLLGTQVHVKVLTSIL